jgi:hypothetical protein
MKQNDIIRMIDTLAKEIAMGSPEYSPKKELSKYKFSREWYQADFYYADFEAITDWCIQQFGPHPRQPDAWSRWRHNGQDRVFFRDAKDYHWYILRWGQ